MSLYFSNLKSDIGRAVNSLPFVQSFLKKGLTVFVFHEVTDDPSPFQKEYGLAVSRAIFEYQVSWILSNFRVVHPRVLFDLAALPPNAALITFDDGFVGTFENGLRHLSARRVSSLVFLNMKPILEQTPMLSAKACYLARFVPAIHEYIQRDARAYPVHLSLTPAALHSYEQEHGLVNQDALLAYQGRYADRGMVTAWSHNEYAVLGNHLFDHWNAAVLNREEFVEQFQINKEALSAMSNNVGFFAFPNGQPGTCFTQEHVAILRTLGVPRVFSAAGGVNRDPGRFVLGRIALGPNDGTPERLWGCVFKGAINRAEHAEPPRG